MIKDRITDGLIKLFSKLKEHLKGAGFQSLDEDAGVDLVNHIHQTCRRTARRIICGFGFLRPIFSPEISWIFIHSTYCISGDDLVLFLCFCHLYLPHTRRCSPPLWL